MKQIRILHNRLLLISILLLLIQISGTCQEHNDDLKMPVYTIEGKEYREVLLIHIFEWKRLLWNSVLRSIGLIGDHS